MEVGQRLPIIERLDHRQDRAQQIGDLLYRLLKGRDLLIERSILGRWLILKEITRGTDRPIFRQEAGEGQIEIGDQFGAACRIEVMTLAVDHVRRGRCVDHRRIVRRNPTSGFDMERPARAKAADRIVDPGHGRDQAGFGGAREVGSAKAKAGLQRAVLVEDDAWGNHGTPDDELGKVGMGMGSKHEVYPR